MLYNNYYKYSLLKEIIIVNENNHYYDYAINERITYLVLFKITLSSLKFKNNNQLYLKVIKILD